MEVAVATMAPGVDQWILILDAGGNIHMFLFADIVHAHLSSFVL